MSDVYTNIKGKNSTNYIFEPSSTDVTSIVKIIATILTSIGWLNNTESEYGKESIC